MIEKDLVEGRPDMKIPQAALGAVLLAWLAGCSMTPAYERPAAPVPAQFPAVGEVPGGAVLSWREYYSDPALRVLMEAALDHNRDLKIAVARTEEARALARLAAADRFPTAEAQGSAVRSHTPAGLSGTGQSRAASRYDLGFGMTAYELDFWGRVAALAEAARAQYLATEEAALYFRTGLVADVANNWFQLTELAQRERLAAETLKTREESVSLVRKRRDAGLATDLDALAAEGLAESVRVQWADLRRQRLQTENALRLLTGMAAGIPVVPAADARLPPAGSSSGLSSEVLLRRPDVRAAEQRLIAANANVGAARAAFFPRIALTASVGTASEALSGLFAAGSEAWLFQPVLKLPLFDAGRTRANVDVAEARKVQAVAEYEKTVQQAFREVADALAARATLSEQLAAQEANLRAQQARFERVRAREQAGIANYLEVLDASRDAFNAEQAAVSARRQLLSANVSLYKALGGGE